MKAKLYWIVLAQIFLALSLGLVGPIYVIYFEKLTEDVKLATFLIGIYWIFVGLFEIIAGNLCDKYGKARIYFLGTLLVSISIFLYPFASELLLLIALIIIDAIGTAFQIPSFYSLVADITSKRKRGKEVSIVTSSYDILYGFSSIIAGIIISYFGFHSIFTMASLINLVSGIIIVRNLEL
ncbi:MAG: MFS transporter [Candidatus Aenigmatarchaeota archaeon]